jgi:outer membrane beta-barrel protein
MENQAANVGQDVRSSSLEGSTDPKKALSVGWGWVLAAIIWLTLVASAWTRNADAAQGSGSDEYSFSWLDKDKKIYVLQNRRYTKSGRVQVTAGGGVGSSNPYRDVRYVEPRVAVYFSEALGIEAFYSKITNSANATFEGIPATLAPYVREINSQTGAVIHWVPWYAKINVFNKILYFDWGFSLGGALLDTTTKYRLGTPNEDRAADEALKALVIGTSQQFFLSHHWSVRLDVTGSFYSATYKLNAARTDVSPETTWFSNFQYGLGLGYRL